jgi:tetratricopeptide (TPR) repeat protein
MRDDNFLDNLDDDQQWLHLVDECRKAFLDNTLNSLEFTEEEYDYLLDYFAEEAEDEIVGQLAGNAYEKYPYSSDIIIRYTDVLIAQDKSKKALDILNSQLSHDPGNSDINFLLGRGNLKLNNYEQAREYISKAISLNPEGTADMLITAGQDFIEQEEYQMALDYFDDALLFDKEDISLYDDIAFCLDKLKRSEESLSYYLKYLDQDPFSDYVWFNVGTLYARNKDYDKAMEAFDYAIALNSQNSSALYNKAVVYIDTQRYELGIKSFKELLTLEPDNMYAMLTIASASLKLDDPQTAKHYYNMALEMDPEDTDANSGLAYIMMAEKDHYSALNYLRKIAGSPDADYTLLEEQLLVTFKKTKLTEFLVYYLVSQYHLNKFENFNIYVELLIETDEPGINKLYTLLPNLRNDAALAKRISLKRKTR